MSVGSLTLSITTVVVLLPITQYADSAGLDILRLEISTYVYSVKNNH